MKLTWIKLTVLGSLIILGASYLWIGGNPSRHALRIVPGTSFKTVTKMLGSPNEHEEKDGMILYYFKPNLYAAGPTRIGFDNQQTAIFMKIWEDAPPQWDLRVH